MSSELVYLAERYVLESQVSTGGMATVWRARDEVLARTVAVKVLHAHLAEDRDFLERFRREALAAARLTHPNIVAIYDTGSDEVEGTETHFIVMEYCGGGTLASTLDREGPLPPERVASIGQSICDALAYAHRNGVIHRDVKPANVLVSEGASLKVADFGIAKAAFVQKEITTTGSILGTVTYVSPEQARGEEPDARSDLYGLGVVLYELLLGRPPFQGETQMAVAMAHVQDPPSPPRSVRAGVPRSLEAVILRALEKDPERRFPSAEEMRVALAATSGDRLPTSVIPSPASTRPPSPPHPAPVADGARSDMRWVVRVVLLAAAAVAAALLIAALVPITNNDGGRQAGGEDTGGGETTNALEVRDVSDFDPYGEGQEEHSELADLAGDGDTSTEWTTESYNDSLELVKPGVGLVFDLGEEAEVASVTVTGSSDLDIEIRAANEIGPDENGFEEVRSFEGTSGEDTLDFDATVARYWLVWITSLPGGGGGRASIAEVDFGGA